MTWSNLLSEAPSGQGLSWQEAQEPPDLEVIVRGATSPLETGSLFGRGHGVLAADRSVGVTFLLGHQDFLTLRDRALTGATEISLAIRAADVTAVDVRGLSPRTRPFA
jgi:hypothetical protein